MKTAKVVIGANFGDEGKGLTTDYLASKLGPDAVVTRFNGGAQASHTVVSSDGIRHAFSHFGSGTLAGARTHLSKYFIVNPVVFRKELIYLRSLGFNPKVSVSPEAKVTTLYDMAINQLSELKRGVKASCGMGINETIVRCESNGYGLIVDNLVREDIVNQLYQLLNMWVPKRINQLDLIRTLENPETNSHMQILSDTKFIKMYLEDVKFFLENCLVIDDDHLSDEKKIIFEGAQGLRLDQDHKNFPWVTHSKTGLHNIVTGLLEPAEITDLDVYYVTRCYITRHGYGPLDYAQSSPPVSKFEDRTNVANPYQGHLRYGLLDIDSLNNEIQNDFFGYAGINKESNIVITCLDQEETDFIKISDGTIHKNELIKKLKQCITSGCYISVGPTREDVYRWAS